MRSTRFVPSTPQPPPPGRRTGAPHLTRTATLALLALAACTGTRTAPPEGSATGAGAGGAPDGSAGAAGAGGAPDTTACGNSHCESTLWPRLAIVFGDAEAAKISYTFTFPDRTFTWTPEKPDVGFCPAGYGESAAYHCDIGIDTYPAQALLVTVAVEGASVDVALKPFNYCGIGMAELRVSVDHGAVSFSPVQYVDVCGP